MDNKQQLSTKIDIYLTSKYSKGGGRSRAGGASSSLLTAFKQGADFGANHTAVMSRQAPLGAIPCLSAVCCVQVRGLGYHGDPQLPQLLCLRCCSGSQPQHLSRWRWSRWGVDEGPKETEPKLGTDLALHPGRPPGLPAPSPQLFLFWVLILPFSCPVSYPPHQQWIMVQQLPSGREDRHCYLHSSLQAAFFSVLSCRTPRQQRGASTARIPLGDKLQVWAQPAGCAATAACSVHK